MAERTRSFSAAARVGDLTQAAWHIFALAKLRRYRDAEAALSGLGNLESPQYMKDSPEGAGLSHSTMLSLASNPDTGFLKRVLQLLLTQTYWCLSSHHCSPPHSCVSSVEGSNLARCVAREGLRTTYPQYMCSMPLCAGPISQVPFVMLSLRAQLPLLLGRAMEGTRALQELLQYCQDKARAQHAPAESSAPEGEALSLNAQIGGHHLPPIKSPTAPLDSSDAWLSLNKAAAQKHLTFGTCVIVW